MLKRDVEPHTGALDLPSVVLTVVGFGGFVYGLSQLGGGDQAVLPPSSEFFSSKTVRRPSIAASMAAAMPAPPPPTTMTSVWMSVITAPPVPSLSAVFR